MNGVIGEIRGFGGNFAPRTWALCSGQLLAISSNTALFSIIGTTYGGDGRTSFALPDLRGRIPISSGTGPGLSPRKLGQRSGTQTVVYNALTLANHFHSATWAQTSGAVAIGASTSDATEAEGGDTLTLGVADAGGNSAIYTTGLNNTELKPGGGVTVAATTTLAPSGAGQSVNNMMPYLTVNWIICMQGIFPSRS